MIDLAATIEAMKASGMTSDEIVRALACVQSVDAPAAPARTARQERNRRYYESRKASEERLKASEQVVSDAPDVSPKEKSPTPPKEITPSDIPPATPKGVSAPRPTPRSELVAVLSPIQADAVIAHRQRIGKPMTAHAARLLAAKFGQCPNPNAAADTMISNGWQGFEPKWLNDRNQSRGSPPAKPRTAADFLLNDTMERINGHSGSEAVDRVDAGEFPGITVAGTARRTGLPHGR